MYVNRVGMASSDTHEEDPALLRLLGFQSEFGLCFVWCFDSRLGNTKHPLSAAHSLASWKDPSGERLIAHQIWQISVRVLSGALMADYGLPCHCPPRLFSDIRVGGKLHFV